LRHGGPSYLCRIHRPNVATTVDPHHWQPKDDRTGIQLSCATLAPPTPWEYESALSAREVDVNETGSRPFGAVLDELCLRPVARRERFTNTELAQIICARGGDITDGYISHLRKGHRDNPTLQTIEDLAAALQVSPAVFVGGRRERHGDERPRRSFSAKLHHLFEVVYPIGRGPYTPEEVAKAISRDGRYGPISASYIRDLLGPPPGTPPNPRLKHILGLAEHFGLTDRTGPQAAYFLDDELAASLTAELADFVALREAGVIEFATRLAERAAQWSPHIRRQVVRTITTAVESGAVESGDTGWVFSPRSDDPGGGTAR
jgi:transcriptional regulator with XRE-family HTH domain